MIARHPPLVRSLLIAALVLGCGPKPIDHPKVEDTGGLLPAVAFTIVAATGNVFAGLWYPVNLAALCFVVGALALPETRGRPMHE